MSVARKYISNIRLKRNIRKVILALEQIMAIKTGYNESPMQIQKKKQILEERVDQLY